MNALAHYHAAAASAFYEIFYHIIIMKIVHKVHKRPT